MAVTLQLDAPPLGSLVSPAAAVRGWLSSEHAAALEALSLESDAGDVVPLRAVDRPDVRNAHPTLTTSGFAGWIDARIVPARGWRLTYRLDGRTASIPVPLAVPDEIVSAFAGAKSRKLAQLRALLVCPLCRSTLNDGAGTLHCARGHEFSVTGDAYQFAPHGPLPDGTDAAGGVSAHGYDAELLELIAASRGPILDVGAGLRPDYREDVINVEMVPYPTTDVVAAGESLPFADGTFDLVISVAVLEHVRDPFAAAKELVRVLRPGGRIFAAVPFLQPYHGYPDHYYNMTAAGLRNLFAELDVERLGVPASGHPIFALTWIVRAWLEALPSDAARRFAGMKVGELGGDPLALFGEPFVAELPAHAREVLGALNVLVARKHEPD